jgi:hypothetical protein
MKNLSIMNDDELEFPYPHKCKKCRPPEMAEAFGAGWLQLEGPIK